MITPAKEILVIGLGLIGSSIAKAAKNKGLIVNGYDKNESSIKEALNKNIIDASFETLDEINNKELVKKVDIVIVAVSPKATQRVISEIKNLWNTAITITDTSSVKNHLNFDSPTNIIFSHPIAGSDKSGISGVDDQLFINKKTIICNPHQVDESHLSKLRNFWEHALSMRVEEMSVKDHDLMFAMTSHLPHLISYALIDSIRLSEKDPSDNAGGGLKEFIRLSGSNPEMWKDIFIDNKEACLKDLNEFKKQIEKFESIVVNEEDLEKYLQYASTLRSNWNE